MQNIFDFAKARPPYERYNCKIIGDKVLLVNPFTHEKIYRRTALFLAEVQLGRHLTPRERVVRGEVVTGKLLPATFIDVSCDYCHRVIQKNIRKHPQGLYEYCSRECKKGAQLARRD